MPEGPPTLELPPLELPPRRGTVARVVLAWHLLPVPVAVMYVLWALNLPRPHGECVTFGWSDCRLSGPDGALLLAAVVGLPSLIVSLLISTVLAVLLGRDPHRSRSSVGTRAALTGMLVAVPLYVVCAVCVLRVDAALA